MSQPRQVNAAGLALIRHFEGLFLKAYQCPAGVWTIGYGHTGLSHNDGTVFPGRKISEAEAVKLLEHDLAHFADVVDRLVSVELSDHEFAALVSFTFNLGAGNLARSTLLKKLNRGDKQGAADEFLKWTRAAGKPMRGLERRRAAERALFLGAAPTF